MFVPLSDEPNPRTIPYVTTLLVVANVGIWILLCLPMVHEPLRWDTVGMPEYLRVLQNETGADRAALFAQASAYDLFSFRYGYRPAHPSALSLITSLFLHAGWMHLLGNMLFLWIFGNNVEARLGGWGFLATYVGCGVIATLSYGLLRPDSPLPLIGASGAISGILGCYMVWFPRNRVRVLVTLLVFWRRFSMPAWSVLGFYLVVENILPLALTAPAHATGVAHGAHVGGFVAGAGFALARSRGWQWPWRLPHTEGGPKERLAAGVLQVRARLQEGAYEAAWLAFLRLPPPGVVHLGAPGALLLADWHTQQRNYPQAQALLAELDATLGVRDPAVAADAALRLGLLTWRGLHDPRAAEPLLRRALAQSGGLGPLADAARAALGQLAAG